MSTLYCACCGQPFQRASSRGPAPLYCSRDCRRQMEVRRRVWSSMGMAGMGAAGVGVKGGASVKGASMGPERTAWGFDSWPGGGAVHGERYGRSASA